MNKPDIAEVREKRIRVTDYLVRNDYDAFIIGRQDNFAWFTCGGNNRVLTTSETGFTILVVTKDACYAVSQVMDGPRVFDEELEGLDIQPVFLKWYEESREKKAMDLVPGLRVLSDIPLPGAAYLPGEIYNLHYPLTAKEIDKCRWIGKETERIIRKVADEIKPGMTEHEAEAMFLYEYGLINATPEVLLVGSDERIPKYRHPNPSDKKMGRFVLLHPGLRKWGLHANVTRLVYFGDRVPDDIAEKYETASMLEAWAISMCRTGERFGRILEVRKQLLAEKGYGDEWKLHYPGGITGYLLCDPTVCATPGKTVEINQVYDWFVTITGVKVEELSANTEKGREVLSVAGFWPVKRYECNGQAFDLPEILLR